MREAITPSLEPLRRCTYVPTTCPRLLIPIPSLPSPRVPRFTMPNAVGVPEGTPVLSASHITSELSTIVDGVGIVNQLVLLRLSWPNNCSPPQGSSETPE